MHAGHLFPGVQVPPTYVKHDMTLSEIAEAEADLHKVQEEIMERLAVLQRKRSSMAQSSCSDSKTSVEACRCSSSNETLPLRTWLVQFTRREIVIPYLGKKGQHIANVACQNEPQHMPPPAQ